MQNLILKTSVVAIAAIIGVFAAFFVATPVEAQFMTQPTQCVFNRDLWVGSYGEDVRCLQRYLNASGYPVAYSGTGSYGRESYSFGPLTAAAVMRWQAANGQQATGVFRVSSLAGSGSNPYVNNPIDDRDDDCNCDGDREDAKDAIDDARDAIDDADEEIDDARRANKNVDEAEDLLDDARDDLRKARRAYNDDDYEDAMDFAEDAEDNADEAIDEIGSSSNSGSATESNARRAIEDADDAIDEAWEEIDDADDDGLDVDDAEDLLEEAEDAYDDAIDAFDDKNYSKAIRDAEDAEDLADDAVDEIDD